MTEFLFSGVKEGAGGNLGVVTEFPERIPNEENKDKHVRKLKTALEKTNLPLPEPDPT